MKRSLAVAVAAFVALPLASLAAQSVSNINPAFQNENAGFVNNSNINDVRVCWGNSSIPGAGAQPSCASLDVIGSSGYNFMRNNDGLSNGSGFSNNTAFSLGTFRHFNFPILSPFLTSVQLSVDFNVSNYGIYNSLWNITHQETPNKSSLCPGDDPPCNDIVAFMSPAGENMSDNFNTMTNGYTIEILGWGNDGETFEQNFNFETVEGQISPIQLWARITEGERFEEVPEPASFALIGLGLVGMIAARRRRNA